MSGIVLDIIIVAVALLLLIFGIWRGMYKLIFGLVSALLAVVLTVVLLSPTAGFLVEKTTLDERLTIALDQPLANALPNGEIKIALYDLDEDGVAAELGYLADGTEHAFSELLAGSNFSMFSGIIENVVKDKVSADEPIAFITVFSSTVVGYIISAIVFVSLFIIFAILVRLLMSLIKKVVTRTYLGHFINKIIGAVLGLGLAIVLIWGSLAVIRLLGTYEWIIPVNNVISDSTLTKLLFENNFIYKFLTDNANIKEVIDKIISGAGAIGAK